MIEHKKNGYLARPFDVHDLAYGISWVLEDEERRRALAQAARKKVLEDFAPDKIAGRMANLYQEILHRRK